MFLFILESIGTPELILIALVALIVLGPRKLPQMMKTLGKTMSEFRNATSEFKTTWEREVTLHENGSDEKVDSQIENPVTIENKIIETSPQTSSENLLPTPEIKEISAEDFSKNFPDKRAAFEETHPREIKSGKTTADKRDWF